MTIGEFASRTRLTQKALRLYDAQGLLEPAVVDGRNGYRPYSPDQLPRARRISLLRELGVPLARIAQMVDLDGPALSDEVRAYWAQEESQHRARADLARYVINVWKEGTRPMYTIETRDVDAAKVLSLSKKVKAPDLPTFIPEATSRIFSQIERQGAKPAGPPIVMYHEPTDAESAGLVEACVPLEGSIDPTDDFVVRVEPAHREAFTRIAKGQVVFLTIMQAYDAVAEWVNNNDATITGAPREVYFDPRPWLEMNDADPAADIAFPFTP
jgi:DNA-binding transcriptional MerR regulator